MKDAQLEAPTAPLQQRILKVIPTCNNNSAQSFL